MRVAGTSKKTRAAPFLPSSVFRSLMCPFGEFREKYEGFVPPLGKLDFFPPDRIEQKNARSYIELVEFGFPSRRNSDESPGEVITVMRPVDIFFMGKTERL